VQLTQFVRRAAQANKDGIATEMGDRKRTWPEFLDRIQRLAGGMRQLGVAPGDRVAMLALNSDRYLEYFFAVPWAGGVFVPVNTRLAGPEIVYWLNDSSSKVLFVDDNFLEVTAKFRDKFETVEKYVYVGDGEAPSGMDHYESLIADNEAVEDAKRCYDDLAGLFYTGGTTGVSKGVMLSHTNLVSNAAQMAIGMGYDAQVRYLHAGPMFHLADGTNTFGLTMVAASHTFIPSFDPVAVMKAIDAYQINTTLLVPTMVNMVVNHPEVDKHDVSTLRHVLYGASPMPEAVIRRAMEVMPKVKFWQAYGQTEASPLMTLMNPDDIDLDGDTKHRLRSCGLAAALHEIKILDEDDNEVPRGTVGQICGRGPNVMQGYWNKPELTEETLRNGWLHTGDGGYMDEEGFVYVVDRVKDMIISGGENVYSAEVESAVQAHPAVAECAVIGVPHEKWGEQVHAIVRMKEGEKVTEQEIIDHCHELIANYKCPRSVSFRDEPLPLSGAGKILKTELRKPFWEGQEKQVH
jgi:long-chain acyl-CoA synthetase